MSPVMRERMHLALVAQLEDPRNEFPGKNAT
jgi:hypothetical protein